MSQETEPDESTRQAEEEDAERQAAADRPPTTDEEEAAERGRSLGDADSAEVAKHYEEMADLGANVKGEGEI